MPLAVSSLTGDASNVFDWILSLNPGAEKYHKESPPEASGGCH